MYPMISGYGRKWIEFSWRSEERMALCLSCVSAKGLNYNVPFLKNIPPVTPTIYTDGVCVGRRRGWGRGHELGFWHLGWDQGVHTLKA